MSDQLIYAIIFGWVGFSWGVWWAERKHRRFDDPALRMLAQMFGGIIEKRKIVGRYMTISSTHHLEIMGEKVSIIVEAKGDPLAFIEGEVVE